MGLPQPGIFTLGNLAHAYLEFNGTGGTDVELVTALATLARRSRRR